MASRGPALALVALALLGTCLVGVHCHGSLSVPRSRNVINPIQGQAWWKDHGNGHGGGAQAGPKPLNGPGVCGDPYQHYWDGSHYLNRPGPSQVTYTSGQSIQVDWWIQVNHGGRIGVKLCPRRDNINQACFDQYPLVRADMAGERFYYIMGGASMGTLGSMSGRFMLPAGVSCSGGCVLQWEYLTMNSCFEPCNRAACGVYADRRNPVTGQFNMGTCCFNCNAANVPEVFRNCADITINPTGGGGSSGGGVPPPTTGCQRTAASGGSCGSGTCCPSGQCCSKWGWCGVTADHCGGGCQRGSGACWASAARRSGAFAGAFAPSNVTVAATGTQSGVAEEAGVATAAAAASASIIPPNASTVDPTIDPPVAPEAAATAGAVAAAADPAVEAAIAAASVGPALATTAAAVDPAVAAAPVDPAVVGK